ncbi:MAG TPA: OsmC family peroxiredoxin [Egibacteraceae bacterium]|jgi:lipoyl-dependent peroxiredoxin|nr:OsmC family peroxiredoxin [Egibacteraceae bacterium]
MPTDRQATTIWQGDLASGTGQTTLDTTNVAGPFEVSWPSRAEEPKGRTSPEELLAAAHSACFSMALSKELADMGNPPERLETSAVVTFVPGTGVTASRITVRGTVPGLDTDGFTRAAEAAKTGCPISGALAGNVDITLDAQLA